jgi:hypothetical protein
MTDRELKRYAITGMLVRIEAEEKRIPFIKDEKLKANSKRLLEELKNDYNNLLDELRK